MIAALRVATASLLAPKQIVRTRGSLPFALGALRALSFAAPASAFIQAPRPWELAWAEDLLGVRGAALVSWYRRAWWGREAARAVARRIQAGRAGEVDAVLDPVDWTRMDEALASGRATGAGAILVGAHVGPRHVPFWLAARRYPDVLMITERVQEEGDETLGRQLANAPQQRQALVRALAHLRRGRIVAIAGDGPYGGETLTVKMLGRPIALRRGAAALARIAGVPAVVAACTWRGHRLGVDVGPVLAPTVPRSDALAWERQWLEAYARWLEQRLQGPPEDLRLFGGLWDRSMEWAL